MSIRMGEQQDASIADPGRSVGLYRANPSWRGQLGNARTIECKKPVPCVRDDTITRSR